VLQTQDLMDRYAVVRDLRLVISAALRASPIYEPSLRRDVRAYVRAERRTGGPPGHVLAVIVRLIDLIEKADLAPAAVRRALVRRVIVWSVEAYFGPIGGDGTRRDSDGLSDAPLDAELLVT
jgi:hypothetical protein